MHVIMTSMNPPDSGELRQYVGGRIRTFRIQQNLTQLELAKLAQYDTFQAIALIEKGERGIPLDKLEKIAQALNQPMESFLPSNQIINKINFTENFATKFRSNKAIDNSTHKNLMGFAEEVRKKFGKNNA
jgi:transcriptional regulator with XRE-family HTH domain